MKMFELFNSVLRVGRAGKVVQSATAIACLSIAVQAFAGGTAWIGKPPKRDPQLAPASGKHKDSFAAASALPQPPDSMLTGGAAMALPEGKAPLPRDTRGEAVDTGLMNSSGSEVFEHIGINRVVSYLTDSYGTLDPSVFASGIISENARLTLIVQIAGDPKDDGKPVKVVFTSLNGHPLGDLQGNPVQFTFILGQNSFEKLDPVSVPSRYLNYGIPNPNLNPLQTSAISILQDTDTYKPKVGKNQLVYSFYSSETPSETLTHQYFASIYSYLEFDAVAPIILVHGTNADHTSWTEPKSPLTIVDTGGFFGVFSPFVKTGNNGGYFEFPATVDSAFKGVWYSAIDLGVGCHGNDGIENSADQLFDQLIATLRSLGSKSCHLIAHSKGGTDTRMLFLNYDKNPEIGIINANNFNQEDLMNNYKILSLYTIGTPHMGTPLSDIAHQINPFVASLAINPGFPLWIDSPDVQISRVGKLSTILALANEFVDITPNGEACKDQCVGAKALRDLWQDDHTWVNTGGHFYNILGDADLDYSESITGNETAGIAGSLIPNYINDFTYYIPESVSPF